MVTHIKNIFPLCDPGSILVVSCTRRHAKRYGKGKSPYATECVQTCTLLLRHSFCPLKQQQQFMAHLLQLFYKSHFYWLHFSLKTFTAVILAGENLHNRCAKRTHTHSLNPESWLSVLAESDPPFLQSSKTQQHYPSKLKNCQLIYH